MKKTKKILAAVFVMAFVMALLPVTAMAEGGSWGGGDGSDEAAAYLIEDGADLALLAVRVNAGESFAGQYFKLTNDIDLADQSWMPIGTLANPFAGHFDGGGYIVEGLFINDSGLDYAGLFGVVGGDSVSNLWVVDADITAGEYAGGVAGFVSGGGSIANCHVTGEVNGGAYIGGLAGELNGSMKRCSSSVKVTGDESLGGLAGKSAGLIRDSFAEGSVSGNSETGGLVGWMETGSLSYSYSNAKVSTTTLNVVGGLVGRLWADPGAGHEEGEISNAYHNRTFTLSGIGNRPDLDTGKTDAQMKEKATFSGWDFETTLYMQPDGYPRLISSHFAGGSGTDSDPYLICTAGQLAAFGQFTGPDYQSLHFACVNAPKLTSVNAIRTDPTSADITFTSDKAGTYYYKVGGTAPQNAVALIRDVSATSGSMGSGDNTIDLTALTPGAKTVYISAEDAAGYWGDLLTVVIMEYIAPVKTVSISTQSGTLTAGTVGSATFTVTTANIASGSAITLNNTNDVAGITLATTNTTNDSTAVTISTTTATPQGSHPLTLTIDGVTSGSFNLTVQSAQSNPDPVTLELDALGNDSVTARYRYTKQVQYTYNGSGSLMFSASGLPTGIAINSSTGAISGSANLTGSYIVTVTVTDGSISDSGTYTLTVNPGTGDGGDDGGGTPTPTTPTYTYRTLTHASGVILKGNFTADAVLVVTENALHPAGTCAACDEIRAKGSWTALYDISITGSHSGNIEVSIPVSADYNGRQTEIWHCKQNHTEKISATAGGGYVTATFSSLSPFAVFATMDNNNPNTGAEDYPDVPQTGDNSDMGLWIILLGVSFFALAGIALLYKRRQQKDT